MQLSFEQLLALIDGSEQDNADALRNRAAVACAIKRYSGTKEEEDELRARFEWKHGRVLSVWARVYERFADTPEYNYGNGDCIIALAYLCQLPENTCMSVFGEVRDNINDGGTAIIPFIRALVEEHRPRREHKRANLRELARAVVESNADGFKVISASCDDWVVSREALARLAEAVRDE